MLNLLAATAIEPDAGLISILTLAVGTGMLHALDADHVAAVSSLAAGDRPFWATVRASAAWAIGHGVTLLAIGIAVYLFGMAIPEDLSALAERSVGLVLVLVGGGVIVQLLRNRAHLHVHTHDHLPAHAHLHTHDAPHPPGPDEDHRHEHRAVLVGTVHGAAGSAPLLALIPLSQVGSAAVALGYLLTFGLGVFVAMAVFGGVFGGLLALGSRVGRRLAVGVQAATGTVSVALGVWLLAGG